MSDNFYIKHGATLPVQRIALRLPTEAVDLTTASEVRLFFDRENTVLERVWTIDSPASAGIVSYTFLATDWDLGEFEVGVYRIEAKVTYAGGGTLKVPSSGFGKFSVKPDLEV